MKYEQLYLNIKESIDKYKVAVVVVNSPEIPFAYTIGLTELNMPEVIITGNMRPQVMQSLVNHVAYNWIDNGVVTGVVTDMFTDKDKSRDFPADLVPLDNTDESLINEYGVQAYRYYEQMNKVPEFVQLLWSDEKGNLPSSPNFELCDQIKLLKKRVLN